MHLAMPDVVYRAVVSTAPTWSHRLPGIGCVQIGRIEPRPWRAPQHATERHHTRAIDPPSGTGACGCHSINSQDPPLVVHNQLPFRFPVVTSARHGRGGMAVACPSPVVSVVGLSECPDGCAVSSSDFSGLTAPTTTEIAGPCSPAERRGDRPTRSGARTGHHRRHPATGEGGAEVGELADPGPDGLGPLTQTIDRRSPTSSSGPPLAAAGRPRPAEGHGRVRSRPRSTTACRPAARRTARRATGAPLPAVERPVRRIPNVDGFTPPPGRPPPDDRQHQDGDRTARRRRRTRVGRSGSLPWAGARSAGSRPGNRGRAVAARAGAQSSCERGRLMATMSRVSSWGVTVSASGGRRTPVRHQVTTNLRSPSRVLERVFAITTTRWYGPRAERAFGSPGPSHHTEERPCRPSRR